MQSAKIHAEIPIVRVQRHVLHDQKYIIQYPFLLTGNGVNHAESQLARQTMLAHVGGRYSNCSQDPLSPNSTLQTIHLFWLHTLTQQSSFGRTAKKTPLYRPAFGLIFGKVSRPPWRFYFNRRTRCEVLVSLVGKSCALFYDDMPENNCP